MRKENVETGIARRAIQFVFLMLLVCAAAHAFEVLAETQPATAPPRVRLANGEWPPYTSLNLPNLGCDSQVVTEAFALEGIGVEYDFFPWARGTCLLQSSDTPSLDRHRLTHIANYMRTGAISSRQRFVLRN